MGQGTVYGADRPKILRARIPFPNLSSAPLVSQSFASIASPETLVSMR
jgi:hypothetical protein